MNLTEAVTGNPPKNYVVFANYTLADNPAKSQAYTVMLELAQSSCRQFLAGDYEIITLTGNVQDHQEGFRKTWQSIDDLFHKESCNILFLDTDTVFLNPVEIFNKFFHFTLFNYTDPKGDLNGKPYFNCGVRYYPATMHPVLWGRYRAALETWPMDLWDYEQQCLNAILWSPYNSQTVEECYRPDIVYQTFAGLDGTMDEWNNGVHWLKAGIIHYHGSRGNERLGLAQQAATIRSTVC